MKSLAWLLILVTVWSIPLYAESKRPDERILWQLFHARKYRLLKQALTEYQKQYPNWQPPAELMRWLSASRRPTHAPWQAVLKATLRRSDYPQLRQLAKRYPQAFGCHSGDALLAVAAAYAHVKDEEAAFAWYQKALRCFDLPARDVLDHALWQLTPQVFARLLDSARTRLTASTYEEFVYQNTKRRILSTLQHPQAYLRLDPTFLDQAVAHRDVDAILAIAWALQQREDFAQARAWFEAGLKLAPKHEGLASGLLHSLIRLRQDQAVLDAGERYPKLRQIAGGYLLMRAWEYYRQGNYTLSQRLVEPAAQWLSGAEEANYLLGWLAFQRRDYVQAKQIFEALFLAHPERKDYAHALVTTWLQSGADLDHLAERFPQAVIQTELAPYRARRAYERKQFLRAYLTDPQSFAELGRLTAPDWGMGGMARFKSGQAGLDRLTIAHAPWYGGNYTLGTHRFGLHLSRVELHSSQLRSAGIRRFQGSKTLNRAQRTALEQEVSALRRRPPPNSIEAAWLELSYRLEGKLNPYFQLGLTPIGGQFSPQPTARLGISDWLDSSAWKLYWHVETYRQPVRQSLLSYT
ncbi:MAG: hypothetical protein N3A55_10250, partial [Methylohalobius sp.]|nr:hypothetical protein [Methylohalobius sp.]